MNNIFFFIKNILPRNSPDLICFIVFELYPQKDMFHFALSICDSVFIDQSKKERLKKIYYKACACRFTLKRFIHRFCCRKLGPSKIEVDLYKNPLSELPKKQKISLIENNSIFDFRLSDLLTMWKNSLKHSDGLFSDPLTLKNPYTGQAIGKHNLYNIYFALLETTFHIPPLLSSFFILEFDLDKFYIIHYSILHDIAINNYYKGLAEDEKFLDIIEMLKTYSDKEFSIRPTHCPHNRKQHIVQKLDYLLLHYYYTEYSQNAKLKEMHHKKLLTGIEKCLIFQDPETFCFWFNVNSVA